MCPWFRRGQNPPEVLTPYVHEGMTVLEPGPGMGFFTLELARLAGRTGHVVAVDIQPKMLDRLKHRAAKAGLRDRIDARLAFPKSMGIADLHGAVDFTFAFAVVHEVGDAGRFFGEIAAASKPGAVLLLAEPQGHVRLSEFDYELQASARAGFRVVNRPPIRRMHTALLRYE
jgi:SAM-dependent methyltransferase